MDKQVFLPYRIHRLHGQFSVLSRTTTSYDLRISIIYTNINNRRPQPLVFTTSRSWAPQDLLVKKNGSSLAPPSGVLSVYLDRG